MAHVTKAKAENTIKRAKELHIKIGKKPSKPKRPKGGFTETQLENYLNRVDAFIEKLDTKIKAKAKAEALQKQISGLKGII